MLHQGVSVKIGEDEYVLPALSLGQLRNGVLAKLQQHDKLVEEGKLFDILTIRGEIIFAALKRNYPDFDEAKLLDHLDMSNTTRMFNIVIGVSGLGETQAGATAATSPATPGT